MARGVPLRYREAAMTPRGLSGALLLPIVLCVFAILPLAYASPPDPTWVSGFFDDGDSDDAIFLITSAVAAVDQCPPYVICPVPIHEPAPAGEDPTLASVPCLSTADARASPNA